ncbi:phage tail protein [Mesorhizobium yinganensis]|uniref:phage tail protein n=1 Tax=Mesorhizobium yinganensis TaxID=3157707 RepID=UPI0032B7DEA6
MSDPFLGEIRMFGGSYAPVGWAMCAGQLLSISQNDALYNLIGTTYGGDGVQTFALPQLGGRVPMHNGNGMVQGQMAGSENVTVTWNQMASHSHVFTSTGAPGNVASPANTIMADQGPAGLTVFGYIPYDGSNPVVINANTISFTGGGQPHQNMQPFLAVTFIIALQGLYPTQG